MNEAQDLPFLDREGCRGRNQAVTKLVRKTTHWAGQSSLTKSS